MILFSDNLKENLSVKRQAMSGRSVVFLGYLSHVIVTCLSVHHMINMPTFGNSILKQKRVSVYMSVKVIVG